MNKVLVTGCSGFIGFHLCLDLLKKNIKVFGIDSINSYYSTKLKLDRLKILKQHKNFKFSKGNIINLKFVENIFKKNNFKIVFHLASQPGVIYSYINPKAYTDNNIKATKNLAKLSNKYYVEKFIFTSSSSVYGDKKNFPIQEKTSLKPKNYYARTKIKCEKILTKIFYKKNKNTLIITRPFTVYGSYSRPDMLFIQAVNKLKKNRKIPVYNNGEYVRDFTYVKDVTKVLIILSKYKKKNKITVNICGAKPIKIISFIKKIINLENSNLLNLIKYYPKRKGEMLKTFGSNTFLKKLTKVRKFTGYDKGLKETFTWYKNYKNKKYLY